MTLAGGLAWFADRVAGRERRMAVSATALFFLLSLFSSLIFVVAYLFATVLAVFGWVGVGRPERGATLES